MCIRDRYNGVETLVYDDSGLKSEVAQNINSELEQVGFRNIGVKERPGLVVLRRTNMPAVLVEAGFINSDVDNRLFDDEFDAIAEGIANGLLQALEENNSAQEVTYMEEEEIVYKVQTGAFREPENAEGLLYQLQPVSYTHLWSKGSADSPHTVQPAHIAACIVKCHIIIQRGIHTSRPQSVWNCPQAQHPERIAYRKTEQGRRSQKYADNGNFPRTQFSCQPVTHQARYNGSDCYDHRNNTRIGDRYSEFPIHSRPSGP